MTIISRPAPARGAVCAPASGQRAVTRPGTTPRVGPAAAIDHTHGEHSIQDMHLFDTPPPTPSAVDRPWIYERVLALVFAGHAWVDNRRRRWIYTGGQTTGHRMPTQEQAVLAVLHQQGHVRIDSTRVDMDVNDGRTLRVRRYEPTDSGTELHTRWAGLSPYTA